MRSNVVLPHPDGPSSTRNSPSRIERSTSSTAWSPPNRLLRCRISTPDIGCGGSPVAVLYSPSVCLQGSVDRRPTRIRFHHHHMVIASQGCRIILVTQLPAVTPAYFQILVVRELRKVGFDVGTVRTHRRSELPEPERGFVLELAVALACAGKAWRALVVCRHQSGAVEREVIESVKARLPQVPADVGLVFATADFETDALAAARE